MAAVSPRKIGFEELVSLLISEHVEIRRKLASLESSVEGHDYTSASATLKSLDVLFRQHIADEEAQVLKLLIEVYGVSGAGEAIAVFRQHRPIYGLMTEVKELATMPAEALASSEARLKSMLEDHTRAEEANVFPAALTAFKERRLAERGKDRLSER